MTVLQQGRHLASPNLVPEIPGDPMTFVLWLPLFSAFES